jgi:hypothetical protein
MNIENTSEQISKHYTAAMDSVNLVNVMKAKPVLTDEEVATPKRNQEHLVGVLNATSDTAAGWQTLIIGYYEEVIATVGNIVNVVDIRLQGKTPGKEFIQVFVNGPYK